MTGLKYHRIERGLSQSDVGLCTGMPQAAISLLETGRLAPRPDQLQRLAKFFGVPADELLRDVLAEAARHEGGA